MQRKDPKRDTDETDEDDTSSEDEEQAEQINLNINHIPMDSRSSESDLSSDSLSSDSSSESDCEKTTPPSGIEIEDEVIKALETNKEKKKLNRPPDLSLTFIPSTFSFHPTNQLIAVGAYTGEIALYEYPLTNTEEHKELTLRTRGADSVRELAWSHDGKKLLTACSGQDILVYDVNEGGLRLERTIAKATNAPVSSLYTIDEHCFATGDDDGSVKVFDSRSQTPSQTYKISEDSITQMITNGEKKHLIASSSEGAIYSIKLAGKKVETSSEIYPHGFTSLALFKQESKLAVGTDNGDVHVFNWGEFGKHSDTYTGLGEGINALIAITERIIISAGDDGVIRAFNFYPMKHLGVVGKLDHPVDKMDICNDGHLIGSIGSEQIIKFWNVEYFGGVTVPKKGVKGGSKPKFGELERENLPSSNSVNCKQFYQGLE